MTALERPRTPTGLRFEPTITVGNVIIIVCGFATAVGCYASFQSLAATSELRLHIVESAVANLPKDEQQLVLLQAQVANHEAQIISSRATEATLLSISAMIREDLSAMKAQIAAIRPPSGN